MYQQETTAQETGNLFGGKSPLPMIVQDNNHSSATLVDFVVPMIITLGTMPLAILYSGGFYLLGGTRTIFESIVNANIFLSLFIGGIVATIIIVLFYLLRKRISPYGAGKSFIDALRLLRSSIILLLLASTFSAFIRYDLTAGAYLASLLTGSLSLWLLPFIFFIIAAITGLATGSSWGTIAIMAPLSVQMLLTMTGITTPVTADHLLLLCPVLGAVFSGAVAGTHISPIADNVLISTTSAGSYHIDHIQSQTPYVLPIITATGISFLLVGFLSSWSSSGAVGISLLVGLGMALLSLYLFSLRRVK
jgi:Na+/H+ antiporter NhaC